MSRAAGDLLLTLDQAAEQPGVHVKTVHRYIHVIGDPGFGAPSRPPLDSDAYAAWLGDVLDGLGLRAA